MIMMMIMMMMMVVMVIAVLIGVSSELGRQKRQPCKEIELRANSMILLTTLFLNHTATRIHAPLPFRLKAKHIGAAVRGFPFPP
jgi:hypothetical protein